MSVLKVLLSFKSSEDLLFTIWFKSLEQGADNMYEMYYPGPIPTSDACQTTAHAPPTDHSHNSLPPEVTQGHYQGQVGSTLDTTAHVTFGFFEDTPIKEENLPVIQEFRYHSNAVTGQFHA